jgi:RNA polymerase subunit RPABC4/transcription elongation factor Spt4
MSATRIVVCKRCQTHEAGERGLCPICESVVSPAEQGGVLIFREMEKAPTALTARAH